MPRLHTIAVASLLAFGVAACGNLASPIPDDSSVASSDASIAALSVQSAPLGRLNICHYPGHGRGNTGTDRDFLVTGPGGFCNTAIGGRVLTVSCNAEGGHKIRVGNEGQQDYREDQCGRRSL